MFENVNPNCKCRAAPPNPKLQRKFNLFLIEMQISTLGIFIDISRVYEKNTGILCRIIIWGFLKEQERERKSFLGLSRWPHHKEGDS